VASGRSSEEFDDATLEAVLDLATERLRVIDEHAVDVEDLAVRGDVDAVTTS
jgi:hypothetical protein